MAEQSILRLADVIKRVGLGKSAIYKLIRESAFPKPVKLTGKAVGWRAAEIDEWIASRPVAA